MNFNCGDAEIFDDDAYVIEMPPDFPSTMGTHAVVIDLIGDDGKIIHQMIGMVTGQNQAHEQAAIMNRWRGKT